MPLNLPIAASGSRAPEKRPRPVPKRIREVIVLMVRGRPDDVDQAPLDFITAARLCGVRPDIMRKWLDRTEVRTLLRAERRAYREAICAGNEGALARVRDKSENGMAVIGAVRALENLAQEAESRPAQQQAPGFVIVVTNAPAHLQASSSPVTIETTREGDPEPIEERKGQGGGCQ